MTFEQALEMEIGDKLYANRELHPECKEGDEVILIARARDHNGIQNDTEGCLYHTTKKTVFCRNIQSFRITP